MHPRCLRRKGDRSGQSAKPSSIGMRSPMWPAWHRPQLVPGSSPGRLSPPDPRPAGPLDRAADAGHGAVGADGVAPGGPDQVRFAQVCALTVGHMRGSGRPASPSSRAPAKGGLARITVARHLAAQLGPHALRPAGEGAGCVIGAGGGDDQGEKPRRCALGPLTATSATDWHRAPVSTP